MKFTCTEKLNIVKRWLHYMDTNYVDAGTFEDQN